MTAAERLKQLSGLAGVSAAAMLLAIGSGATAAELLLSGSPVTNVSALDVLTADRGTITPVPELQTKPVVAAGSGTGSDAGTGYVYIDRAWVKGLKVVKIGTSWQSAGSVKSGVFAGPTVRTHRTKSFNGTVRSTSHCVQKARAVASGCPHQTLKADSACQSKTAKSIVSMYNGSSTSLGADELLAILNWM